MTGDLPEKVWVQNCGEVLLISEQFRWKSDVEYVRADIASAQVAGAYEAAADYLSGQSRGYPDNVAWVVEDDADAIRALTPDASRAALDAVRAEAERAGYERGVREAADRIDREINRVQPEMTRHAQRLAAGKKPGFQYVILSLLDKPEGRG